MDKSVFVGVQESSREVSAHSLTKRVDILRSIKTVSVYPHLPCLTAHSPVPKILPLTRDFYHRGKWKHSEVSSAMQDAAPEVHSIPPIQNTELIGIAEWLEEAGCTATRPRTHQRAADPTTCFTDSKRKSDHVLLEINHLQTPSPITGPQVPPMLCMPQSPGGCHLTHPHRQGVWDFAKGLWAHAERWSTSKNLGEGIQTWAF